MALPVIFCGASSAVHRRQAKARTLTSSKIPGELLLLEQTPCDFAVLDDLDGPLAIDTLDGNGGRPRHIFSIHGCFFDLRATASIKERAAASQAILDGPFANSTTFAAFSDMPYFFAKTAAS
ncbi:hypothetical protein [Mesorhizobium sp. M1396]|uniref:hypothetical protein n=1 Tax=Mesorhizobium sp. M1396 TaxID=2957095 RepID=UPI0033350209